MNKKPYSTTRTVSCVDPQLFVVDILMPKGLLRSHRESMASVTVSNIIAQTQSLGALILRKAERGAARNQIYAEGGYATLPYQ